jgi:hypothetical protein
MSKPVSTLPASEVGKDVTPRARALNQALDLPGPRDRQARKKEMRTAYEATLPRPTYPWLDDILKK